MIDREEALRRLSARGVIAETETVFLHDAAGRVLAEPVRSLLTLPPADMSAMDGYAVRFADLGTDTKLTLIGEAPAGRPFRGRISSGECVRVFTGSVIPDGADHVVIQEDVDRSGQTIIVREDQPEARNIRRAGRDFSEGDKLFPAGTRLRPRHLSICAAANHAELTVLRRPRVGLLSNGDELRPPGSILNEGQIIASNEYSLAALIRDWGGEPVLLGTAPDDPEFIRHMICNAPDIDVFLPIGGASVGDHDHMKPTFKALGFEEVFSKISIKPGKPTWYFRKNNQAVLGLPGNPASALVCAHLFLRPLIQTLLGQPQSEGWLTARLTAPIRANGHRENFLRGHLLTDETGETLVMPARDQDSSLLSPFILADVLIRLAPGEPAHIAGDAVSCVQLL